MKVAFAVLIFPLLTCIVTAGESSGPKARPDVDAKRPGAVSTSTSPTAKPAGSKPVVLSPYIVRASSRRTGASQWLPTPEGAPALSGHRFLDAIQQGDIAEHKGERFTMGVVTQGESVDGFGRLTAGFHISW